MGLFDLDSYLIRRKVLKILGASFHVYDGDQVVGFSSQKAFKLKEDIRIYSDESKSTELLSIQARQRLDFAAAYDIVDSATGQKIGVARRRGFKSILKDSWELLDANEQPLSKLEEDSTLFALLRRFLSDWIPQRFHVDDPTSQSHILFKQHFNPFVYRLEVTIPSDASIDKRLIFALATLIAAIEGRQG